MTETPVHPQPGSGREVPTWASLSMEQSLAMRAAAARLADDFAGIYGTETIERFLHSSFDQFADRATVSSCR